MCNGEISQRFPTPIRSTLDNSAGGTSNPTRLAAGTTSALVMPAVNIRKYELHEFAMAAVMPISPCPRGSQQPPLAPLHS